MFNGSFVCDRGGIPKVITIAPPIQIFDPIFQQFMDGTTDPEIKPDDDIVDHVLRLMSRSSQLFASEDAVLSQLRLLFTDLLKHPVSQAISGTSRNPNGIVFGRGEKHEIPMLLFEYKRSMGEGGCDPSVQAAYSLLDFLQKDDVRTFHTFYNLTPLFLILYSAHRPSQHSLSVFHSWCCRHSSVHTRCNPHRQVHRSTSHGPLPRGGHHVRRYAGTSHREGLHIAPPRAREVGPPLQGHYGFVGRPSDSDPSDSDYARGSLPRSPSMFFPLPYKV